MSPVRNSEHRADDLPVSATRRRAVVLSRWASLPSLYWSIVVGVLTVFSVLQTTLLAGLGPRGTTALLASLLVVSALAAVLIARRQTMPAERLAMARALFSEARRRFGEREYRAAEEAAARSAEWDPEESATWNLLGRTRTRLGKPAEAIEAFGNALDVNRQPDWRPIYLHNRAVAYIMNGEYGRARSDLNIAVAAAPQNGTRLRWRALANYYMGAATEALEDAKSCVKASERASTQALLAVIAGSVGEQSLASRAIDRALRLPLEKPEDYYYVGVWKLLFDDPEEAIRMLAISVQLDDKMRARATFDPFWSPMRNEERFRHLIDLTREAGEP